MCVFEKNCSNGAMRGLGRRKLDCGWNSSCVKRTQFPEQESLFDSCQIRAPRRCNSYQQRSIAAVEVSKERPASPLSKKARNLKIARLASEFFAKIRNRQEQVFRIYIFYRRRIHAGLVVLRSSACQNEALQNHSQESEKT